MGRFLAQAILESYASLPQRHGFVEAGWRIATVKKLDGTAFHTSQLPGPTKSSQEASDAADNRDLTTAVTETEQESCFGFGTMRWNQHGTGAANENDNRVSNESPRQRRA
jgi:hypothetical protein